MRWLLAALKRLFQPVCVDPYCQERGDHSSHRDVQGPLTESDTAAWGGHRPSRSYVEWVAEGQPDREV